MSMRIDSKVVVPWDFSSHSKVALDYALECASSEHIHVLCVLERPNIYAAGVLWDDHAEEIARAKCNEQFSAEIDPTKYPGLKFAAEFGDPATEIVRYAKKLNASAIVISTHGRSGIARMLLGSVAQKVAQKASCPVTLLPHAWFETRNASSPT